MPNLRTRGQRAGITRADVLDAARDLVASSGLPAVTMRAVAQRLDVAPNALYSHVRSKGALLDDLLDDALAGVQAPPDTADPADGLHRLMSSTYEVLLAHAELVPVYLARQGAGGPHAQRLGATMHALLGRAGVRGDAAQEALRVLVVYTIGFAAFTTQAAQPDGQQRLPPVALTANFATGLRWLLDGVLRPA